MGPTHLGDVEEEEADKAGVISQDCTEEGRQREEEGRTWLVKSVLQAVVSPSMSLVLQRQHEPQLGQLLEMQILRPPSSDLTKL